MCGSSGPTKIGGGAVGGIWMVVETQGKISIDSYEELQKN